MGWRNVWLRALLALMAALAPAAVAAQAFNISALTANRPHFGVVAAQAGTATVDVTINTAGNTVTASLPNTVVNATGRTAQTITVTCTTPCTGASQRTLTVTRGTGSGRLSQITGMTLGPGTTGTSGTIVSQSYNAGTGVLTATISGWTANNQARTFNLGVTVTVVGDTTNSTTSGTVGYTVAASNSRTGTVAAAVRRSMAIAKNADLVFGAIRRPASATGTVTINSGTGARTAGGTTPPVLVTGITAGRALFTATGTPSVAATFSAPATMTISDGTTTLTSTLSLSNTAVTLSGGGTFQVGVGGVLTVPATATLGNYTGSFTVTVTYN